MKRNHRRLLNLCSLALLAFALYLTFIKKDAPEFPRAGAALIESPGASLNKGVEPQKSNGNEIFRIAAVK